MLSKEFLDNLRWCRDVKLEVLSTNKARLSFKYSGFSWNLIVCSSNGFSIAIENSGIGDLSALDGEKFRNWSFYKDCEHVIDTNKFPIDLIVSGGLYISSEYFEFKATDDEYTYTLPIGEGETVFVTRGWFDKSKRNETQFELIY